MIIIEKQDAKNKICPFGVHGNSAPCSNVECMAWQNMELKEDNTYRATSRNTDKGICLRLKCSQ